MDAKEYVNRYRESKSMYACFADGSISVNEKELIELMESYHLAKSREEGWEWTRVDDRLPEYSGSYLIANTNYGWTYPAFYIDEELEWYEIGEPEVTHAPTHWMSLPSPSIQYGTYDGKRYPVGARLTSLENGEIIEASPDTPEEEIVCVVKAGKNA